MRDSERRYHTAVGWWLMTHDRASAVIFGTLAAAVSVGTGAYIAHRWRSLDGGFERGVVFGAVVLTAMLWASALIQARSRAPRDRAQARAYARRINVIAIAAIVLIVVVAPAFGPGAADGSILGEACAGAALFVLVCARSARRR